MKLNETVTYKGADPAAVFALISDPAFRRETSEAMNATSVDVDVDGAADGPVTVTITRTMPAELPDFVKKMVGDKVGVKQVETWDAPAADGSRSGKVEVTIKGQPAQMNGTTRLAQDGADTALRVDGDVSVKIPIVGRKIEPEVAKAIVSALRVEAREGQKRL